MTLDSRNWREIASLRAGDLRNFPYPLLLAAIARTGASVRLEMERPPVEKSIDFLDGVPIDCRSNLAHETFGRYLVSAGKLSQEEFNRALSESLSREVRLGEVLLERELLTAETIYQELRANLGRRLLDGFTWATGSFRLNHEPPAAEPTVRVRVPQLILTGVVKLTPIGEVDEGVAVLRDEPLILNPSPPFPSGELSLRGAVSRVVQTLGEGPRRMDELCEGAEPPQELRRAIYALTLLETVVPAASATSVEGTATAEPEAAAAEASVEPAPSGAAVPAASQEAPAEDLVALTGQVLESHLTFRGEDAFDLLRLSEDADPEQVESAFLERSRVFAPWQLEAAGLSALAAKAEPIYLAIARAYAELSDPETRTALVERRRTLREERAAKPPRDLKIETDLLDAEVQYQKGCRLLEAGEPRRAVEFLQFAADCDPQSPVYRAEAAYQRYLLEPRRLRDRALAELEIALRIDPGSGLALYRIGRFHQREGNLDEAEEYLRRSIRKMAPDRRPIDALRGLKRSSRKG